MANNVFTSIAEALGNINRNVVDLYNLVVDNRKKIEEIHELMFPPVANEGGSENDE